MPDRDPTLDIIRLVNCFFFQYFLDTYIVFILFDIRTVQYKIKEFFSLYVFENLSPITCSFIHCEVDL
jgi:hypothetical protein